MIVDIAFPVYLTNISTIARFGTTIVFVLIVLGWFYVLALIILAGAVINALRRRSRPVAETARDTTRHLSDTDTAEDLQPTVAGQ